MDARIKKPSLLEAFTPKLVSVLREHYRLPDLKADAIAGLTVAIVALPLSMAIAIASGVTPDRGLYTAIVGGFIVSLLGGSRFQIGGPAGAFIVLIAATVTAHGVDGLLLATVGLALFARAPAGGSFLVDVLPGMLLLGTGAGIAFNPVLLAAMSDVDPAESGLASGVVNTSFMMGGALGLAVLASLAAARSETLGAAGTSAVAALNGGYQLAFLVGAVFALVAALLGAALMRTRSASGAGSAAVTPQEAMP